MIPSRRMASPLSWAGEKTPQDLDKKLYRDSEPAADRLRNSRSAQSETTRERKDPSHTFLYQKS